MNKKSEQKRREQFPVHLLLDILFVGKVSHNFFFTYGIYPAKTEALKLYNVVKLGCNPLLTDTVKIAFGAAYFHIYSVKWDQWMIFAFAFF